MDETRGDLIVHSEEETGRLAAKLLPLLMACRFVSLEGPLGAGKTCFVKAVCAALGLRDEVKSPTFALLQTYGSGTVRLHHSDWYRLDSPAEALALGLEEYYDEGLMIIEWGNKFPEILPPGTLRVRISPEANGSSETRRISWEGVPGNHWKP